MAYYETMPKKRATPKKSMGHAKPGGFAEGQGAAPAPTMDEKPRWTLYIGANGRVVIPAAARAAMQLGELGKVTAVLEDGELRLISPLVAIARLQELVKKLDKGTGSIADELIAERRAEALKE
jgi:bifunctional DNA-binding transcriptional regulator/antitoxin component of YhaV-PrlF toxin-antitoxin module